MAKQENIFEVDLLGRRARKLGLSPEHEVALEMIDASARLSTAMEMYEIAVVDCEMSRLGAGDRSNELKRVWNEVFGSQRRLKQLTEKWRPIDTAINATVDSEVNRERVEFEARQKADGLDKEFRQNFGGEK
jgi:hypothetical protein